MHKCVVCGNSTTWTRDTRPEVLYHGFPKNEQLRRIWLKVLGFDHCYDWQRICSDHFLDENYRPGKKRYLLPNTIPQPYDKNCDANDVLSNYIIQNNNTKTDINELVLMEQSLLRRSYGKIKLTTTNESMPRLQTERYGGQILTFIDGDNIQTVIERNIVPVLTTTKDFTLGNGLRCSVKNCFNRHSEHLSLFGFPSDFTLRKKWIENCGLNFDPTKNSVRVCSVHFENDCFTNSKKRNRLRPKAVPTLFLDNDVMDTRNILSSSLRVNSGLIHANKPSCSSSNYIANVESNQTPLLVYIDSTTRYAKDFEAYCSVPGCITNTETYKEVEDISLFAPTKDCVNKWSSILGLQLTVNSIVCERHFRPQDILKPELLVNGLNEKVKSLSPDSLPVPIDAMPSSSSNIMPKSNTMLELRTYGGKLKRPKANEADKQLSKKIRNNVPEDTYQNISTCDVEPTLKLNSSEFIDNKTIFFKPIFTTDTPYSSELPKIKTPVISKCISLARNSEVHESISLARNPEVLHDSYSDNNSNTSECIIIDDDTEDNGFIFEIYKSIVLPNLFWRVKHLSTQNVTGFYQRDMFDLTVKKILFFNSLVPIIQVYGKKYEYNNPITTMKELENLLEKIDDIEECFGMDGIVHERCIGYFEDTLDDIEMCSACQGIKTDQSLQKINATIEFKSKTIESLERKISERKARVLELKKIIEENKKNAFC
ncbi:PREDICTED: uncharacterized protein LOC107168897 isoform X2 [Diuraphis noxia]|uniref:uncharacterized protein LOC107168897 isoform X2 n=1 Tax=Diuraphis noxia TaxID=143948 RepID=UPI000763586A|nr:PREDICTED: uncharacterized protein LOC107168897 isoform X2 [Diuraphis noxia]